MRSVFSPWACRESAADLHRAEGMLGVVVAAAGASLVRWAGLAVLTLMVPVYLALSAAQLRRCHGCSHELSGWALLEVYVACAAAGAAGFVLLV